MRLGHPSFTSVSKFCLEILPAVVAFAVVGYLLSSFQPDRADGALPPAEVIQSTRASEIEEARSDRAMMREVIRTRRIAEEQAAEQAREAKVAAENAPPPSPPVKEASPAASAKEAAPLPPPRRVAQAPRSEPKPKPQAKPAVEAKPATAPIPAPQVAEALPPPAPPVEENKGPVMFVVGKAGELTRKAVEAVAWVVSMPASLMTVKGKIFGETPPPQQSGHILKGS
jgi:hypothetical protein